MTSFRVRPRFNQIINKEPDQIKDLIASALENSESSIKAIYLPNQITLKIDASEKHYWSPQLNLTLEKHEDGTRLRGLYGPNPSVWAIFFFSYSALSIIGLFAGMVILSQYMLKMETPLWWVLPLCLVLGGLLYIIAQTGQKIGAEQMFALHHFYEETLGEKVPIS
jgi:hypothetical protein